MKPTDIIHPLSLEEAQAIRRLSRHPDFREKAAEVVNLIRANRDQVQEFADKRKAELVEAEKALATANRRLQDAEAILSEVGA